MSNLLYVDEDSWLSRQHPLTKLFALAWAATLSLLVSWQAAVVCTLLLVLVGFTLSAGRFVLRRWLLTVIPLSISLFLIHGFFLHHADLKLLGVIPMSHSGITDAAVIVGRIGFLLAACLLFVCTTHPAGLLKALDAKGVFPGFGYLLVSPLLLLDLFAEHARSILAAQQTRGLPLEASAWTRLRALPALLVPLITVGLLDTHSRSAALTARAFRARHSRTVLDPPADQPYGGGVRLGLLVAAVLQGGLFIWLKLR